MNTYHFRPNYSVVAQMPGMVAIDTMEQEQGMYSATPEFAMDHGGSLTRSILALVPDWYYAEAATLGLYPNIDVRIHRLYPGDIPAYPGWHCDGEWRETYFSQPDLNRIKVHKHLTLTLSTHELGVSNTQFLDQAFTATVDDACDVALWGQVHEQVEQMPSKALYDTTDGQLVCFDAWSLHRAMPARIRGWRLFFRMSMWHRPNLGEGGKLTKQEQVYKITNGSGW